MVESLWPVVSFVHVIDCSMAVVYARTEASWNDCNCRRLRRIAPK